MSDQHEGSCLCGAVRFRTKGALREIVACHCGQCRKQTGLYYAATNVRKTALEIEGADAITWYKASSFARRGFCGTCGSALFWEAEEGDFISILAGAFDTPLDVRIERHIFCADKAAFYEINGDVPQYAQGSPGLAVAAP